MCILFTFNFFLHSRNISICVLKKYTASNLLKSTLHSVLSILCKVYSFWLTRTTCSLLTSKPKVLRPIHFHYMYFSFCESNPTLAWKTVTNTPKIVSRKHLITNVSAPVSRKWNARAEIRQEPPKPSRPWNLI